MSQGRFGGEDGGLYNENGPLASSDEWKEKGAALGVQRDIDANGNTVTRPVKKGVKDFNFGRTLGEGSYSTVCSECFKHVLCAVTFSLMVIGSRCNGQNNIKRIRHQGP